MSQSYKEEDDDFKQDLIVSSKNRKIIFKLTLVCKIINNNNNLIHPMSADIDETFTKLLQKSRIQIFYTFNTVSSCKMVFSLQI